MRALVIVVGLLWGTVALADSAITPFVGEYRGRSIDGGDGGLDKRDLSVEIRKTRKGFSVAWTTITPDPAEVGKQVCVLIDSLQAGQLDLASVDIVPPTHAELVINAKTARKIGLDLTDAVIQSARRVYE